LGSPRKKQVRFRLRSAAAPTLFSLAAAFALSAQAGPASASTVVHHAGSAALLGEASSARLLSAVRLTAAQDRAAASKPAASLPAEYTVHSGDSLSTIAQKLYHDPAAWPVLYWANRSKVHWADSIDAGQVLTVPVKPARIPAAPSQLAAASVAAAPATGQDSTGQDSAAQSAPAQTEVAAQPASTYTGGSSFQQCVIERESGGDSQVVSSGGYYGLYQFSASTWAEYGGNPADYGDATTAEQNQVFDTAVADGGESNWSAYDGC
jgi:LysM repeat protein